MKAAARVVFLIWWGLAGSLFSQERIQEQATVINIATKAPSSTT